MQLVSLASPRSSSGSDWVLTLQVPAWEKGAAPAVDISADAVRLAAADGSTECFELPSGCRIDVSHAACTLRRKSSELVITWKAQVQEEKCSQEAERERANPAAAAAPAKATSRIDYSKFAGIGDKEEEEERKRAEAAATAAANVLSQEDAPSRGAPGASGNAVPQAEEKRSKQLASLDYSKFGDISEEDADLSMHELKAKHHKHVKLRRMRGEEPLDLEAWRRLDGAARKQDDEGRGLWCRTNLEEAFQAEASREDVPPDEALPEFSPPEILTAMSKGGLQVLDLSDWAGAALRQALIHACSTDRSCSSGECRRVDAIAASIEVRDGNAAAALGSGNVMCAYRFACGIEFCVSIAERASPSAQPTEARFMGSLQISELASGGKAEDLPARMTTKLKVPKPEKEQMAAVRPVLQRFECSVAYWVRRFERQMLLKILRPST